MERHHRVEITRLHSIIKGTRPTRRMDTELHPMRILHPTSIPTVLDRPVDRLLVHPLDLPVDLRLDPQDRPIGIFELFDNLIFISKTS